ncbi:MAG: GPW/gp25 family protein [Porticoccaceae bacterium]
MNAITGHALGGLEHLKQSIRDILTTPIGSRVMRRQYGSHLFSLVDAPTNRMTISSIYAATAAALRKWEPRFKLQRVALGKVEPGRIELTVYGTYVFGATAGTLSMTVEVTR